MGDLIEVLELVWDSFGALLTSDAALMALTVLPLLIALAAVRALL